MPSPTGQPLPGEPGYQPPADANPTQRVPGLINATPGSTTINPGTPVSSYTPAQATAQQAQPTGYDPKRFAVADDQTVQGQLKGILSSDSPLMQQAETRARQQVNQRGLLNSSLGIQAGQEAVIGAALPIAQQDAQTYNQAMTNTTNAQNAALQFGATAQNQASQTNAQLGTNVNQVNAEAVNRAFDQAVANAQQISLSKLTQENQVALANIDNTTKQQLALLDAQNRQLLQANQGAANAYVQAVQNIANIAGTQGMTPEAKEQATTTQLNLLREQLQVTAAIAATQQAAVGNLNLSQYFTTQNTVAQAESGAIQRIQAESDRQFGGHWETVPASLDANGDLTPAHEVWVRNQAA